MKQLTQFGIRAAVILVLSAPFISSSVAQHHSAKNTDPARWSKEDTSSPVDYLETLKKEAAAAYKINLGECKTKKAKARAACEKEARAIYKQDLADAEQKAKEMGR